MSASCETEPPARSVRALYTAAGSPCSSTMTATILPVAVDLNSGNDRGRIYRIVPESFRRAPVRPWGQATTAELVAALDSPRRGRFGDRRKVGGRGGLQEMTAPATRHRTQRSAAGIERSARARTARSGRLDQARDSMSAHRKHVALGDRRQRRRSSRLPLRCGCSRRLAATSCAGAATWSPSLRSARALQHPSIAEGGWGAGASTARAAGLDHREP